MKASELMVNNVLKAIDAVLNKTGSDYAETLVNGVWDVCNAELDNMETSESVYEASLDDLKFNNTILFTSLFPAALEGNEKILEIFRALNSADALRRYWATGKVGR